MFSKILKTILGVLFIPLAIAVAMAFTNEISSLSILSGSLRLMERGILAYFVVHIFIFKPVYIYVLGHELVHVLATWMCGGSVVSFRVTTAGGNVVTSKTNFFIELSPYFVPLYTILIGLVFWVIRITGGGSPKMSAIFLFLAGLTMAFHFVMTSDVLKMQQSDIAKSGIIFSSVIIFIFNIFVVGGIFSIVFDSISFVDLAKNSLSNSCDIYSNIYNSIIKFANNHKFW